MLLKKLSIIAALLLGSYSAPMAASASDVSSDDSAIEAALASKARSEKNVLRDPQRKPEIILALTGVKKGDTVVDLFSGAAGYYAELYSQMVGPEGLVVTHGKYTKQPFVDGLGNAVHTLSNELEDVDPGVDLIFTAMNYHDLMNATPEGRDAILAGWLSKLKSGGTLVVIDHNAAVGEGDSVTNTTHRVEDAFVKEEITAAGFEFVTSIDALRNPEDDHTKGPFDPSIRGKTDRFVLKFMKP